jgi:peroxin-10
LVMESLEVFIKYRFLSKFDAEIKMGSDFLYYLLTTIRGKQTLGEEYCSIIPVSANPHNKMQESFPSLTRRIWFCILNVAGPYIVNKIMKRFE